MIPVGGASRPSIPPATSWFTIYGYPCGISTASAAARALLRRLYAPFVATAAPAADVAVFHVDPPAASSDRRWWVRLGGTPLHVRSSLGAALQELEYEICQRVIAHRPDLMAVH